MNNRKWLDRILSVAFVLLLPLLLLMTDIQLVTFDRDYYRAEYAKYNIPQNNQMDMEELMKSTNKLLLYMEGKRDNIDFKAVVAGTEQEFFTDRDKQHMVDVRGLFDNGFYIRNISFLVFLLVFFYFIRFDGTNGKNLAKFSISSFFVGMIPIILLMILMNIDFYKYFTIFHEIFFNNDLWLLDPAKDRLINLYPENFFSDMAFRIAYLYITELVVLLIGGIAYLCIQKRMTAKRKS